MAAKWFYPLQEQVKSYIVSRYGWHQCLYQDITADRVYEAYFVKNEDTSVQFLVFQLKRKSNDFTVLQEQTQDIPLLNRS